MLVLQASWATVQNARDGSPRLDAVYGRCWKRRQQPNMCQEARSVQEKLYFNMMGATARVLTTARSMLDKSPCRRAGGVEVGWLDCL